MLIYIIGGVCGATVTFLLQKYGLNIVAASCIVGLIGWILGEYLKQPHLTLVIFSGSFVGMSNFPMEHIPFIIFGGILSGFIYKLSLNIFVGFGGRLGAIAFLSTLISYCLIVIIKKFILSKINIFKTSS